MRDTASSHDLPADFGWDFGPGTKEWALETLDMARGSRAVALADPSNKFAAADAVRYQKLANEMLANLTFAKLAA